MGNPQLWFQLKWESFVLRPPWLVASLLLPLCTSTGDPDEGQPAIQRKETKISKNPVIWKIKSWPFSTDEQQNESVLVAKELPPCIFSTSKWLRRTHIMSSQFSYFPTCSSRALPFSISPIILRAKRQNFSLWHVQLWWEYVEECRWWSTSSVPPPQSSWPLVRSPPSSKGSDS